MEQTTNRCEKNLHEQLSYVQEKCKTSFTCTTKLVDLLNLPKQFVKISSHDKNIFLYVCACIFTYMYTYMLVCGYECVRIYACVCMYICVYVFSYYIHVCVCMYMFVYVCMYYELHCI